MLQAVSSSYWISTSVRFGLVGSCSLTHKAQSTKVPLKDQLEAVLLQTVLRTLAVARVRS
jgi:hypothetical protein